MPGPGFFNRFFGECHDGITYFFLLQLLQGNALGGSFGDAFLFEFEGFGYFLVVAILDAVDGDGEFVFLLFGEQVAPVFGDGLDEVGEFFLEALGFFLGFFVGGSSGLISSCRAAEFLS